MYDKLNELSIITKRSCLKSLF